MQPVLLQHSCLHARKHKEYSYRISSHSAAREDKPRAGSMHIGFQCLLNEYTDDTDLQYYDFGDPALSPQTPADLHHYVTHTFRRQDPLNNWMRSLGHEEHKAGEPTAPPENASASPGAPTNMTNE